MMKDVKLTPEKAVIIGRKAIISDLHIGLENYLQERGVSIPRIQIDEIVRRTKKIIEKYKIKELIIAGDLKHEFGRTLPYELKDIKYFIESIDTKISIVRGNHDNYIAHILADYGIELRDYVKVRGYYVVHGHKEVDFDRVIMGHEHPSVKMRIRGGLYSYPCYLKADNRILVLPAFSPLVSGNNILQGFISPMLKKARKIEIFGICDEVVYLGTVDDLKKLVAYY